MSGSPPIRRESCFRSIPAATRSASVARCRGGPWPSSSAPTARAIVVGYADPEGKVRINTYRVQPDGLKPLGTTAFRQTLSKDPAVPIWGLLPDSDGGVYVRVVEEGYQKGWPALAIKKIYAGRPDGAVPRLRRAVRPAADLRPMGLRLFAAIRRPAQHHSGGPAAASRLPGCPRRQDPLGGGLRSRKAAPT